MAGYLIKFNVFLNSKEESSEMGYTRGGQYIFFNIYQINPRCLILTSSFPLFFQIIFSKYPQYYWKILQKNQRKIFCQFLNTLGLFGIEPGEYTVFSKAENWAEISIIAKAGDIIFIEQNVKMGFVMARNSLTKIANSRGKYYIKKNIGSEGKIFKTNL